QTKMCADEVEGMPEAFADLESLLGDGHPLGEVAELGEGPDQEHARVDRAKYGSTKVLIASIPFEQCHTLLQAVHRPPIVADGMINKPEVLGGRPLHDDVCERPSNGAGTFAYLNRSSVIAYLPEAFPHTRKDASQTLSIAKGLRQGLAFPQAVQARFNFSEW